MNPFVLRARVGIAVTASRLFVQALAMLWMLGAFCAPQARAQADASAKTPGKAIELLEGVPDVTILVIPTGVDSARVSVAYRAKVDHSLVRQEIHRLEAAGWEIGNNLTINDGTLRPEDPANAPVTTYAAFRVHKAPQVRDNAPALAPYLQAFHDQSHVSVVFNLSELQPYNGVDNFDSAALTVRRISAENAYQYEALIRDHKGRLPALAAEARPGAGAVEAVPPPALSPPQGIPLLPLMLLLMAGGVAAGLVVYSWLAKRAARAITTRNMRY